MNHILPTPDMWRALREAHDTFNARLRDGYNPNWSEPGDRSGHDGDDFYSRHGTGAVATESGSVHWAGRKLSNTGAGKFIEVYHPNAGGTDEMSRYLHLSEVLVKKGEWVEQGQVIGKVGCTGQCNMAHVHYGLIRLDGGYDPKQTGLGHIRRRGAVWLDPVDEGILTNTPNGPPLPPPEAESIVITRPTITRFEAPYQEDADVADAQSALANRDMIVFDGNFNDDGSPDGLAGPLTRKAVLRYQRSVGLPPTGNLDPPTWQRLMSSP